MTLLNQYISDILDLLSDHDSEGSSLRKQITFLTDISYNYTGSGLFVTFKHSDAIFEHKLSKDLLILNGVTIKSNHLHIGAKATLFIKNGVIDYLEIWAFDGVYPEIELDNYSLTQTWDNAPGRVIIR